MSNKRSWTIEHNCDYDYCVRGPTLKRDELVRVIEYSAYERLEKIQQDDESDKFKLMTERDALKAQLAEVTRENLVLLELAGKEHIDRTLAQAELRAERAKLSENIEAERELRKIAVGIERAKAERYREALKLVEKETIEMGIHGLVIYVQQALTEAEGE